VITLSTKEELREHILDIRNRYDESKLSSMSQSINNKLNHLSEFKEALNVSTYVSKSKEVGTIDFIMKALRNGKNVLIPIVEKGKKDLRFSQLLGIEELEEGSFGVLEPKENFRRFISGSEVDIAIIPGVVWSIEGHRIGYGKGYYDRYLSSLDKNIPTVGLSYDFQLKSKVPVRKHDIGVQIIVTESKIIRCTN